MMEGGRTIAQGLYVLCQEDREAAAMVALALSLFWRNGWAAATHLILFLLALSKQEED